MHVSGQSALMHVSGQSALMHVSGQSSYACVGSERSYYVESFATHKGFFARVCTHEIHMCTTTLGRLRSLLCVKNECNVTD